jgi:AcrR family transcriptional regulator
MMESIEQGHGGTNAGAGYGIVVNSTGSDEVSGLLHEPKQERSRAALKRVLDAVAALLSERGPGEFTISEISARSGVSTGSIYGRAGSKDDLVRAVHARLMAEMADEQERLVSRSRWADVPAVEMIPSALRELAELLQRHAVLLRAFTVRAVVDPAIREPGRDSYFRLERDWIDLVLTKRAEIVHVDPDRAVSSCFNIAYSTFSRYLGLDPAADDSFESSWPDVAEDVIAMCTQFLVGPASTA